MDRAAVRQPARRSHLNESISTLVPEIDNGLHLPCLVDGVKARLLVDSGAMTSVISTNFLNKLPKHCQASLEPTDAKIVSASGDPILLKGRIQLKLDIGGLAIEHSFLVAKISGKGLLGMDFLRPHNCILDISTGSMVWKHGEVPLEASSTNPIECCKITLTETTTIPPLSEMIIKGQLTKNVDRHKYGVVEPQATLMEENSVLLAAELVSPLNRIVPLRVMNPGHKEITIHRGMPVGIYSMVEAVGHNSRSQESDNNSPHRGEGARYPESRAADVSRMPNHLMDLLDRSKEHLSVREVETLNSLLNRYEGCFKSEGGPRGHTELVSHRIDTGTSAPIKQPPRRLPASQRTLVEDEIKKMLDDGIIEPSESPWASPIVLVKKKSGGVRFCVDYRKLNGQTRKDAFPLPRIDDTIDALSGAVFFSCLDLDSAYWQVAMHEPDKEKTAFVVHNGLYHFKTMAFGLCNAPSTFGRLMHKVLGSLQFEQCLLYLDDIIVHGRNFEEHLERLRNVLEQIEHSGLKLKPSKCSLFQKKVAFLGYVVSENGIETDPDKIRQVAEWPTPRCVREVRSFVGLASYYRRFVKNFSEVCKPLYQLTEKGKRFHWTMDCQQAFETLKAHLTSSPILAYPRMEGRFILDTDASDVGMGAVLSQIQDGHERVIAYASSTLNKHERRYCVTRKEMLALVRFVKHFRPYLYGQDFLIRIDHSSLRWLMSFREPEGQVARWLELLAEYQFEIQHRPGKLHGNADALSRVDCAQCTQCKRDACPTGAVTANKASKPRKSIGAMPCQRVQVQETTGVKSSATSRFKKRLTNLWCILLSLMLQVWSSLPSAMRVTQRCSGMNPMRCCNIAALDSSHAQSSNWIPGMTAVELRELQLRDPDVSEILQRKEAREDKPSWGEISKFSEYVKALWAMWNQLTVHNGVLLLDGGTSRQLIVPRTLKEKILHLVHNSPTGGHLGVTKTLARLRTGFYWTNIRHDVETWCRSCLSCARRKPPGKKTRAKLQQHISGCPLERIAIDFSGPLPESVSHNRYIMVVTDYFTKYCEAYAIPDITASTAATVLVSEFICRWGVPRQIHTDQGSQFESQLFREMCELLGIDKTRTSPFRPQSDGQVERMNRTIKGMLYHYLSEKQDDWDHHLPLVMMAYRATVHESTKFTPNMLMFGREVECPEKLVFGLPPGERSEHCEYVTELRDRMVDAHHVARDSLSRAAVHQKRNYDHRSREPPPLRRGDSVLLRKESVRRGLSAKLSAYWDGPYAVVERVGPVNVKIKKGSRHPAKVVHVDRLKPFHGDYDNTWLDRLEDRQGESVASGFKAMPTVSPNQVPRSLRPARRRSAPRRFGTWVEGC